MSDIVRISLLLFSFLIIVLVLISDNQSRDQISLQDKNRYIDELCDILYYAEIALRETVDDPEEREIIQNYIDDFHDLIIEDCLYIESSK